MNSILLIDGLNTFMRHFCANPSMNENGIHMGGLAGFLKGLRLLIDNIKPNKVIICWEGGGSSRRRAIYPDYKNKRKPTKLNRFYDDEIPNTIENRNFQINALVKILRAAGIHQIYVSDCEADDIIGYLSKYRFKEEKIIIVSSDKDYYQLLNERILQWSPGQKNYVTSEKIIKKFFIPPHNFCLA